MTDRLPIFRMSAGDTGTPALIDLAKRIFGIADGVQISRDGGRHVLRSGSKVVELARESGGVWAADESQLWKPSLAPKLVGADKAAANADKLLRTLDVPRQLEAPFRLGKPILGGTHAAIKAGKHA